MVDPIARQPVLLTVCLPAEDEFFRLEVEHTVEAMGADSHVSADGLLGVMAALHARYPDAGIDPVVLMEPRTGRTHQIWWYVHRDGRPQQVM